MTTHQLGWRYSYLALVCWLTLGIVFFLLPHQRFNLFLAFLVPVLILVAGTLRVRCRQCRKSVFLTEVFGRRDTFVGWVTSRRRPMPEQTCSRCGADLTVQER
jgi:hypothetical protein